MAPTKSLRRMNHALQPAESLHSTAGVSRWFAPAAHHYPAWPPTRPLTARGRSHRLGRHDHVWRRNWSSDGHERDHVHARARAHQDDAAGRHVRCAVGPSDARSVRGAAGPSDARSVRPMRGRSVRCAVGPSDARSVRPVHPYDAACTHYSPAASQRDTSPLVNTQPVT